MFSTSREFARNFLRKMTGRVNGCSKTKNGHLSGVKKNGLVSINKKAKK